MTKPLTQKDKLLMTLQELGVGFESTPHGGNTLIHVDEDTVRKGLWSGYQSFDFGFEFDLDGNLVKEGAWE